MTKGTEGNGSRRELRSEAWFSGLDMFTFAHRSWNARGYPPDVFDGRPVIGICNSWSELTTCNAHLRIVAEHVKRGVWEAGGLPLEFPTMSLGESMMKPTTMLWRNLMSMDVEESLRANPLDGVVLLCGCDKTTPAQLMGAASVDLPTICVPGGPMLNGRWRDEEVGSGTDLWRISDMRRRGEISDQEYLEIEAGYSRSDGHCNTMGTASTMTSMAEALGTTLTGAAAIPAADSRRRALAHVSGRRIVQMVHDDLRLSQILTPEAFHNAIATLHALGGSTNAVIHLPAIAGRLGIDLPLERFDELSREVPFLANLKPSGEYLMEQFHAAGGVPAVMAEIGDSLELGALTATGATMGENLAGLGADGKVIRKRSTPLSPDGGIVILRGTLAPGSAVIKRSAASERLLNHRGRAYVFETRAELLEHIDDDDLPVDAGTVLVLKNGGPKGGPGMPEWGQLPIPGKLLREGVTDMLRISDARMSGTSYGTVVLHTSPEAAAGGPFSVVQTGDEIELNVDERRLDLLVPVEEVERRLLAWSPPPPHYTRGYGRLFIDNVLGAEQGCDFDFLRADGIEHADYGPLYARMGHS
jgi:dihydroxy-acid dehydratase